MKIKIISLMLALACVFSLAIPARATDAAQFTDASQIDRWEAVAALSQLGVINGKPDGSFDPAGNVTRAEAAKMIFLMGHGGEDVERTFNPEFDLDFFDTVGHWAEKYIKWCRQGHIINGRGDGSFDPDGYVTALEFAKMSLWLLGYGYDVKDYGLDGEKWAENTHKLAQEANLYHALPEQVIPRVSGNGDWESEPLSRETIVQMLYNDLQANIVSFLGIWGDPDKDVGEFTSDNWDGTPLTLIQAAFKYRSVKSLTLPAQPE